MPLRLIKNWYTRPAHPWGFAAVVLLLIGVYALSFRQFSRTGLEATGAAVFSGELWRAWSAVFVHADGAHLAANTPLLALFGFLISAYVHPVALGLGVLVAGATNILVLWGMPEQVRLVGASGLVHWLGAFWLVLHVLVDRRAHWRPRFGSGLFLALLLFTPAAYEPRISYAAHAWGFLAGGVSAMAVWLVWKRAFLRAEVWVPVMVTADRVGEAWRLPEDELTLPAHTRDTE